MVCIALVLFIVFFKQKTAYEMRISDCSSDVCSSDLKLVSTRRLSAEEEARVAGWLHQRCGHAFPVRITYHAEIPRGPSGKFLDFRSAMADAAVSPSPGD